MDKSLELRSRSGVAHATGLDEGAKRFARASIAENTKRAYQAQWRVFLAWCDERGIEALDAGPTDIANWLAARAEDGRSIATLRTGLAAVRLAFHTAGHPFDSQSPVIQSVLAGITRESARVAKQAPAARGSDIRDVITPGPNASLIEIRDAALVAVGYMFALRRSELVGLDWNKQVRGAGFLTIGRHVAEVVLIRSKTANGVPQRVSVPVDANALAITAITRWVQAAGILDGTALFRRVRRGEAVGARLSDRTVSRIVKRLVGDAYSGHSLRVGFCVTSAEAGVDIRAISAVTRHKSIEMPRRYAEQADQLKTSPFNAKGVGLSSDNE